MEEVFLYYIWKFKKFNQNQLLTQEKQKISIEDVGVLNTDSGPDFKNSRIKINNILWVGNLEIHVNSSDWYKHKHHFNIAYDNVILHVVYNADRKIYRKDKTIIPTLELKPLLSQELIATCFSSNLQNTQFIPCESILNKITNFQINKVLESLATERMMQKVSRLNLMIRKYNFDWEKVFYIQLFKYFGFGINAIPFELLAKHTDFKIIETHKTLLTSDALLFGQAGLIPTLTSLGYEKKIAEEYKFLKSKYNLKPLAGEIWKFYKLRPFNFPTLRIAYLSALLTKNSRLFSASMEANNLKEVEKIFSIKFSHHSYWKNHFKFGEASTTIIDKKIGQDLIKNITINVIIPLGISYSEHKNDKSRKQKLWRLFSNISFEKNKIIRGYKKLGVEIKTAVHSQGALNLYYEYCQKKRCLDCSIGNKIINLAN